jgi:AcrR family transcriptional regulator
MQRARSREHRNERLTAILDATGSLFDVIGPDLTLANIADATHLTRTTLYGYAATREELLLLLTERELSGWFERVSAQLARVRSVNGVVNVTVDELIATPRLAPLLALCGVLVERNVSLDAAVAWKSHLQQQVLGVGSQIDGVSSSTGGSGARFLLHVYASMTGLHSLAFPTETAAKAIAASGADVLVVNFERELRQAVAALAHSLLR